MQALNERIEQLDMELYICKTLTKEQEHAISATQRLNIDLGKKNVELGKLLDVTKRNFQNEK